MAGIARRALIGLSENARAREFALRHPMARRVSRRFVAGESLDEALAAVDALCRAGFLTSLNHLGELTASPVEAGAAAEAYVEILERLRGRGVDCYVSVKLTQLGLDISDAMAASHMRRILDAARGAGIFVRIDMEHSAYVDRTLDLVAALRAGGYTGLGAVIQSYLYRSAGDLDRLLGLGVPVRLCKGAYAEPATVAYPRREDVDASFLRLAQRLFLHGGYHAIATHNERLIRACMHQARGQGLGPDRFEFQMIYGIRRDLQQRILGEGYRMRVYVPYGTQWYPYLMRRMAERPANLLFVLRNLMRG
jgi:proline dehydrogenase